MTARPVSLLLPWSGLIAGLVGWGVEHQLGTYVSNGACYLAGPRPIGTMGAICAVLAVIGLALSASAWRHSEPEQRDGPNGARRFIAAVGAMSAALLLLTIVMQTAGAFVIPPCVR